MYIDPNTGSILFSILFFIQCALPFAAIYFAQQTVKYAYMRFIAKTDPVAPVFSILFTTGAVLLYMYAIITILAEEPAPITDMIFYTILFAFMPPLIYLGALFGAFHLFGKKTG